MKIKITIIEIDFPDEQEQPAYKPEPPRSFFDRLCREVERVIQPQPLMEDKLHGSFLAQ